ncbi:DUF2911 domain-containing protein [Capnocytophaga sp. Marseille-Q4570]|uniref:DUF2911 domain-containing protein n=2 Tax=Capnocytophaga TaxID=1016 RepID=A0ABS3PZ47_9FLAO|nr:DUF2911 domain-containing protein [Capnocytophaga bilenii]MBO1884596.1 DUF2911 domain-containing protein [Capnocytophaga bilenii]
MKKITFIVCFLCGLWSFGQNFSYPMASPRQVITQQFSVSQITVDYGRPSVRGRKIFGELVPYGKIWRLGANQATSITFYQPVKFGGLPVKKGDYAIFVTPEAHQWTVVLNYDSNAWGAYSYDPNENAIEFTVPVTQTKELQESLEFSFEAISNDKVNLVIRWEYLKVEIPIEVDKKETIDKIVEQLREVKQFERDLEGKDDKK